MKTPEKLAAGWLLTLAFMFLTLSVSATLEKKSMLKAIYPEYKEALAEEFINQPALYMLDNTAKNGLIFGIPTMLLGGWMSLGLYRQSKDEKKALEQKISDGLQSSFYKMLQENNGRVTVLGLAMNSQLPAAKAQEYLDMKAKEFNADFQVSEKGGVSYHFDI
ncbi:hypothetical protein [Umezakia ovalisporum]|jgi:hypothetical protein|uniref:Uncharacterized protein n=2 Tax=Umezakia ovalisporum TaxID=75695 RepID=A0AA43KFZ3_9CYAN|nr:hypothetical protein [Umezakia ovalisporum]MBI1242013.1 hypothetical protein [Nostoc sp. RI_552]MDH6056620.1 hypothetical protein [Umezakia ovalisporum FSS-43]MDH6065096.1 hypothetical protein [Umezakia ovalisporum FSS-62]MDH6067285.1 hypothetical protein [Umezakia ovalisporum APH033B]MDH6070197.1 hypothetical protein [Umezakia ovalisporum CobakiLakeA]